MNILDKTARFYNKFKGEKGTIGKSANNLPIYYIKIQKTFSPILIVQACIHAREYITSYLSLKLIKDFHKRGKIGCVYFIPMLNPDGAKIALKKDPLYKANANLVDLNVNFDANWGTGEKNIRHLSSENYIGKVPFSEPETRAIRDFSLSIKPDATISYHSKGEEIYYEFFQKKKDLERDYGLAKRISESTGYKIKSTLNSAGGYKDWCIQKLKIPALTIEVGKDSLPHPIKKKNLREIYIKNKNVIINTLDYLSEIQCKKNT